MNDNYLLHNETAKKLYFEYANDLPIIALCSQSKPIEQGYNNITEAFLSNDIYKLNAMRDCGVDEKYITGDSSDYEKFKAFCLVLPKFVGHPLYILSHIELRKHFDCDLNICEDNCDLIWSEVNSKIIDCLLCDISILKLTNIEQHYSLTLSWLQELDINDRIIDLDSLENALLNYVEKANNNGCKIAEYNSFSDFIRPNPFVANEVVKKIKSKDLSYKTEDLDLLNMQVARTLGIEYKKLGWTWLLSGSHICEEALAYLEKNNALPKTKSYIQFEIGQNQQYLELQLREYASKHPLGSVICTINTADNCLCYARNDYLRRIICNIIGEWVENGEYTSDEKILKKLIEDILYNNLKEAIS